MSYGTSSEVYGSKISKFQIWKKFDIEILKFLGNWVKMVKMGQIFIQNGPSEVVGLTKPVLVLTNLSPHHIFRSRTCSRFFISYVIIFIKYKFQIIMLNPKKIYNWTDFLGFKHQKSYFRRKTMITHAHVVQPTQYVVLKNRLFEAVRTIN